MSSNDSTAIATREATPIALGSHGVRLQSLEDLYRFAVAVSKTPFAPKDFKTPEAIMIACQYGMEVGLTPMQSLQSVAVINGKPALYGDALVAVVRASGLLEEFEEWIDGEGDARRAICRAKRKGMPKAREAAFSVVDAKRAGLWGKGGPWTSYPERMLAMRARGFALRDEFADVLRGLIAYEEAADIPAPNAPVTPFPVEVPTETPAEVAERKIAAIEAERAAEPDPEPEAIDAEEEPAEEPTPEPTDVPVPFARAERIEGKTITNKALVRLAGICYGRRVVLEEVAREVFGCSSTSLTMEEAKLLADLVKSRPETRIQPDVARELEELCKARGVPVYQTLADYGVERAEDLDPETAAVMRTDLLN
jgi:cell division septation protein DedD